MCLINIITKKIRISVTLRLILVLTKYTCGWIRHFRTFYVLPCQTENYSGQLRTKTMSQWHRSQPKQVDIVSQKSGNNRSLSFPCFQHHCWYLLNKKITRVVEKDLKCFANIHYSMAIFFRALLTAAKQFCPCRGLIIQLKFYMVTQMILMAFQKLNNHLVMSPNFLNNNYQNNIT